jgi:predicted DNA-binding transcriptional regulator AlpA
MSFAPSVDHGKAVDSRYLAELFGVSASTIGHWVRRKKLPPSISLGFHRRWRLADIIQFARANGIPLPQDIEGGVNA